MTEKAAKDEPSETELDFETIREPWNKYSLTDGTNLKLRFVLLKVRRTIAQNEFHYAIKSQNLVQAYNVPDNLRGPPSKAPPTPNELKDARKQEVGFSTLFEEWCEYMVEDGARVRAKCSLVEVHRADRTNQDGEPVYIVGSGMTLSIKPPKSLTPGQPDQEYTEP